MTTVSTSSSTVTISPNNAPNYTISTGSVGINYNVYTTVCIGCGQVINSNIPHVCITINSLSIYGSGGGFYYYSEPPVAKKYKTITRPVNCKCGRYECIQVEDKD